MSAPGNRRRSSDGGRNDWRTPPELFRLLDMEFRFTLDAAADDENHLCERYLTEAEDALQADVADHVVWCNPPYGDLTPWVTAFAIWAIKGHCTVVALLPAATDTRWFEHVWRWAHEIRLLSPRVRFLRPDGTPGASNTTGSLVAIYRPGVLWQYGELGPVITWAPRVLHVRWIGNAPAVATGQSPLWCDLAHPRLPGLIRLFGVPLPLSGGAGSIRAGGHGTIRLARDPKRHGGVRMMSRTWLDDIRDYTARECLTDDEWNTLLSLAYDGQMFRDLNENGHVVEFDEGGYGLEHPATCRIEGRLLDCPVEVEIRSLTGNPFGTPGRYRVVIGETGVLEAWKLPEKDALDV